MVMVVDFLHNWLLKTFIAFCVAFTIFSRIADISFVLQMDFVLLSNILYAVLPIITFQMKSEFGVDHVYNADIFNEITPKSKYEQFMMIFQCLYVWLVMFLKCLCHYFLHLFFKLCRIPELRWNSSFQWSPKSGS